MRLHVTDPDLLPALLAYLQERPDCIAQVSSEGHIAVSLLGSRETLENQRELSERLDLWRADNVGARVELVG